MRAIEQPVRGSCVGNCKRVARWRADGTVLAVNSDSIARPPIWEATPTLHLDGRRNEPPDTSPHQHLSSAAASSRNVASSSGQLITKDTEDTKGIQFNLCVLGVLRGDSAPLQATGKRPNERQG